MTKVSYILPNGQRFAVTELWNVSPRDVGGETEQVHRMYLYAIL